jgi:predicted metal-dependent phosphoesterase TrpH
LGEKVSTEKEKNYADLHIHSIFSDGSLSPYKIIEIAKKLRLSVISITDHDTVNGYEEALKYGGDGVEIIPAVEMSSNIGTMDIHILGYYIDHKNATLIEYLELFKQHRVARVKKIINNLARAGIKLEFEHIKVIARNCSLGRPHIAEALVANGYVKSVGEAFGRYLGYNSPYYEPKKNAHPRDVIRIIKNSDGIPVIAHPGTINNENVLYQLILEGAVGIEVWHPEHTNRCKRMLYEIALKNGLLMTGGSDCHGRRFGSIQIGSTGCSKDDVQKLKECKSLITTRGDV